MEKLERDFPWKNLKKETIGETYKNFNRLISRKELTSKDNECLQNFVTTIESGSIFVESLKLIIIDSLHLRNQLISTLYSQNNYHINRLLNCKWFFNSASTVEAFCNEIHAKVSVVLRNKLLKKLSRASIEASEAEKLFRFSKENYGKAHAIPFLSKCSRHFIEEHFSEYKPSFKHDKGSRSLLAIARRFPDLVFDLLVSHINSKTSTKFQVEDHEKVLLYLAGNHTDLFTPFFRRFYTKLSFLSFGKKLSRKLGPHVKDLIFCNSALVLGDVFNKYALIRAFRFEDRVNYISAMVKFNRGKLSFLNWVNSSYGMCDLLKLIRPEIRLPIIESVFNKVYNRNIRNHWKLCPPQILEIIPLKMRLPCVKAYEKEVQAHKGGDAESGLYDGLEYWRPVVDPEIYIYIHTFDVAFPKLMTGMAKAPALSTRQDLLRAMVQNCVVNNDAANLEKVVDYVSRRFRNDAPIMFVQFLKSVFDSFSLSSLNSGTVRKMEEMLYLCFVKNERHNYEYLLEKCLLHRIGDGLEVDTQIKQFVDWKIAENKFFQGFIYDFNSEHSRQLFFKFYEEIIKRMKGERPESKLVDSLLMWILRTLMEFNSRRKKNPLFLSHLPGLVPYVEVEMKKRCKGILDELDLTSDLEKPYGHSLVQLRPHRLLRKILNRQPQALLDKPEGFIEFLMVEISSVGGIHFFLTMRKVFSFMGVVHQVKKRIEEEFRAGSDVAKRKNALTMLSYICSIEEFEILVEEYVPKGEHLDWSVATHFSEMQLLVPGVVKNLTPSWKNLDFIFKYFSGDFFNYILPSFSFCCHRFRVDQLIPILLKYLRELPRQSRIAIKKEIIRILIQVCNFREAVNICMECWASIDHYSIRSLLFKKMSSLFLEKPSRELFDAVQKFLKESDDIVVDHRPHLQDVPHDFFSEYVLTLWVFSQNQAPSLKTDIQRSVMDAVNQSTIGLLPTLFCENLIKNHLFGDDLDVTKLTCYYLMAEPGSVNVRLDLILGVQKNSNASGDSVSRFLTTLRTVMVEHSDLAKTILANYFKKWPYVDKTALYDDQIILQYHYLYHKITSEFPELTIYEKSEIFGRELKTFYHSHCSLPHLTLIFADTFSIFNEELKRHNRELNPLIIYKELLKGHGEISLAVLVISLLPVNCVKLYKMKEDQILSQAERNQRKEMTEIVEILQKFQEEVVQIYLNRKLGHPVLA